MSILVLKDSTWILNHGKHGKRKLDEVAEEDPKYLQWVFKKATSNLSDEAFYALQDIMEKHGIPCP